MTGNKKPRPFGKRVTGLRKQFHAHLITNWLLPGIKAWVVHRLAERLYQGKRGAGVLLATLIWWCWEGRLRAL